MKVLRGMKGRTYALHEGRVEAVGEQRLRQLPEVQLERSCDGVDVHVTQHHQDVFGIYKPDYKQDTLLEAHNNSAALSSFQE